MKYVPTFLIGTVLISGCVFDQNKPNAEQADAGSYSNVIETEPRYHRTHRDLTLALQLEEQGGAAMRQTAYVHVLGTSTESQAVSIEDLSAQEAKNLIRDLEAGIARAASGATAQKQGAAIYDAMSGQERPSPSATALTAAGSVSLDQSAQIFNAVTDRDPRSYSVYELSRWERYCNNGKGMDEADWSFVAKEGGANNLPGVFKGQCNAPDFDYQGYLAAWTNYCTSQPLSDAQRSIVMNSVRPTSKVNPCKALTL